MSRSSLTIDAAHRLIRTRLRQYILSRAAEIERRRGDEDKEYFSSTLDSEKTIEAAAEAAWISTLKLWSFRPLSNVVPETYRHEILACVNHGLARAVERSRGFVLEREVEYENDDVQGWVRTFISEFKADQLLAGVPCASVT